MLYLECPLEGSSSVCGQLRSCQSLSEMLRTARGLGENGDERRIKGHFVGIILILCSSVGADDSRGTCILYTPVAYTGLIQRETTLSTNHC